MKWEYKIVDLGSKSGLIKEGVVRDITKRISRLGEDGWEMVGCGNVSEVRHALYFKRPIEEKKKR